MIKLSWLLSCSHRLIKPVRSLPHAVRRFSQSAHRHNVLGSIVVVLAFGYLYIHAQPTTAGTDPISASGSQAIAEVEQEYNAPGSGVVGVEAGTKSAASVAASDTPTLIGKEAIVEFDRVLGDAETQLANVPAYAATFVKQERIGDALTELQVIQLRIHQKPKRVSMKWEGGKDAGQRVIYAEGENDGDMLVRKLSGIEARLGIISLNPTGVLAMKHSRHPITRAGLLEMVRITRQYRQSDLKHESGVSAKLLEHQKLNGRDCLCLVIEYAKPEFAPDEKKEYRKSMIYMDTQTKLPACVRCYGWPERVSGADPQKLDQTTLLELYAYKNIDLEAQVQADDFSRARLQ